MAKLTRAEKEKLQASVQAGVEKKVIKRVYITSIIISLIISVGILTLPKWFPVVKGGCVKVADKVVDIVTPDEIEDVNDTTID
jgi:hypothetical protein